MCFWESRRTMKLGTFTTWEKKCLKATDPAFSESIHLDSRRDNIPAAYLISRHWLYIRDTQLVLVPRHWLKSLSCWEPPAYPVSGHWLGSERVDGTDISRDQADQVSCSSSSISRPWITLLTDWSIWKEQWRYFTTIHLLPDANVPLLDEDTCVVDRLCKSKLEHLQMCHRDIFGSFIWRK